MATRACLLLSLVAAAALSAFLSAQWSGNPDLAHGWATPLVFLLLLFEARAKSNQRFLGEWTSLGAISAAAFSLLLMLLGVLYMAALEWSHALVAAVFTASVCSLLFAVWLVAASKRQQYLPFNWTVAVAILIWFLSAPLPPGTYASLTQSLQTLVVSVVLGLLHLLGIAAVRHGHILQLPFVSVGVEEACSGVRSLLSCVYAGLFFSAVWARTAGSRFILIILSAALAIAMNIVRSLSLTLLAHRGVEIEGRWHDITGYAVVGLTALLLALIARRMDSAPAVPLAPPPPATPSAPPSSTAAQYFVAGALTLSLVVAGLLLMATRQAPSRTAVPDLPALLPSRCEGWIASPNTDLVRFSSQLQTSALTQTTYYRVDDPTNTEITVYLAFWPAGTVPVSSVAAHTPDACWPGSGWSAVSDGSRRISLSTGSRSLEPAEERIFTQNGQIQHVWYWHLYAGRVIHPDNVRSPKNLLTLAWTYGFRRSGDQLFVRISSNKPWAEIAGAKPLQETFAHLTPFGF